MIFVFGSNLAGRHGKGAALAAVKLHGAKYGVGEGLQGCAYAIPTKDENLKTRALGDIDLSVWKFKRFAKNNPILRFYVTAIGTGLAGYKVSDIAPMFKDITNNVYLCDEFSDWLKENED